MCNPSVFSPGEQTLFLKGKAGRLELLTWAPNDNSQAVTAIICHPHPLYQGTMHNKVITTLHRACRDLQVSTVRFNYRGVGKSEGEYGQGIGEADDLLSILDWVKRIRPHDTVWLMGFSFGSGVVIRAQAQLTDWQPGCVLCVAPAVKSDYFPEAGYPQQCPWFVIHGEKDELIDVSLVREWLKTLHTNPPQADFLPDVDHFFHSKLVVLREHIKTLLLKQLA